LRTDEAFACHADTALSGSSSPRRYLPRQCGDKSFAAGAGNLLKVALSIEAQSFGVALLARSPYCSRKIEI